MKKHAAWKLTTITSSSPPNGLCGGRCAAAAVNTAPHLAVALPMRSAPWSILLLHSLQPERPVLACSTWYVVSAMLCAPRENRPPSAETLLIFGTLMARVETAVALVLGLLVAYHRPELAFPRLLAASA